jgi:hypothetical protein
MENLGLKTQHGRIYHQQQNNSGLNQTFTVGDNNNVGHQNQRNNGADNFVHHLNAVNTQKMRPFDPQACSTPTRFLSPQTSNTTNLNLNNKRPFPIGTSGDKNASGGGMFAVPTNPPVKRGRGRPPHLLPNGERARQAVKRIKLNQSFAFGSTFVKNNQQQGMKTEEMRFYISFFLFICS